MMLATSSSSRQQSTPAGMQFSIPTLFTWLTLLSVVVSGVGARDEVLFTSSVSYCSPPLSLLVQRFSLTYIPKPAPQLSFNISASSINPSTRARANLLLNVYGSQPLNVTLDLCDGSVLGGALCPLPTYNFTGSDEIGLSRLGGGVGDVTNRVPGIAYKIPDLEAFAQLTLTDVDTGELRACVQSTLSNGWSTYQPTVSLTSVLAIFLPSLLSALYHSTRSPEHAAPFRFLDVVGVFQTIAISGLLDLNYPLAYRSFTLNFAWAVGLIVNGGGGVGANIQTAINRMRHATGGRMPDANSGSAVDLVNRRLSPYNILPPTSKALLSSVFNPFSSSNSKLTTSSSSTDSGNVALVTQNSPNVLDAGVPVYVNSIGVGTANTFMSAFITGLIVIAVYLAVSMLGWGLLRGLRWWKGRKDARDARVDEKGRVKEGEEDGQEGWRTYYPWWVMSWGLRVLLILLPPFTLFSFYQLTLRDSWLSLVLAIFTFLSLLGTIIFTLYTTSRLARATSAWTLYTHTKQVMSVGSAIYTQLRHERWWWCGVTVGVVVVRSIIVAFAHSAGLVQVILLLLLELAYFAGMIALRPYEYRGPSALSTFLAVFRVVLVALLFTFVESFNVKPIPRVVVGFVAAILCSIVVVIMFFNMLLNLGIQEVWRDKVRYSRRVDGDGCGWMCCGVVFGVGWGTRLSSLRSSNSSALSRSSPNLSASELEKGANASDDTKVNSIHNSTDSASTAARPRNPTPLKNVPLDPSVNVPYPDVTPTTATASWEISPTTVSSGFGSPLPTGSTNRSTSSYGYYSFASDVNPNANAIALGPHQQQRLSQLSHQEPPNSASTETSTLGEMLPRRKEYEELRRLAGLETPTVESAEGAESEKGVEGESPSRGTFGTIHEGGNENSTGGRPSDVTVRKS